MTSTVRVPMPKSVWSNGLQKLDAADAKMIAESDHDPSRRTYALGEKVYKISIDNYDTTGHMRQQSFLGEYAILKKCIGIAGIPKAVDCKQIDGFNVLILDLIDAEAISNLRLGPIRYLLLLLRLGRILYNLSLRGISHNDVRPENVLMDDQGKVYLIDYDQAADIGIFSAFIRNFFGLRMGTLPNFGSLAGIVKIQIRRMLPLRVVIMIKRVLGRATDEQARQILEAEIRRLPRVPSNASPQLRSMARAWRIARISKASSPNACAAYYALDFEGFHFPGERPWAKRWKVLRDIADVRSKRVLELGCNLALLSCYLQKECGAIAGMAVDSDPDILEGAQAVADAFGVQLTFLQSNFDDHSDWETELINFCPDVVFALSVLNWVNDKKRFMAFLNNFREVVFEGHDDIETEMQRFKDVGFDYVENIGFSERQRPILYCKNKLSADTLNTRYLP